VGKLNIAMLFHFGNVTNRQFGLGCWWGMQACVVVVVVVMARKIQGGNVNQNIKPLCYKVAQKSKCSVVT
jgi:hypothetical protein